MKKVITFLLFTGLCVFQASSQNEYIASNNSIDNSSTSAATTSSVYFRFMAYDQSAYINEISTSDAGKHFLGDEIAKKLFLLKKRYCYKEPVAPGTSATKTIFRKPDIYFSVKKIEKLLKDELKNARLTTEDANLRYNKVLDVALNVLDEDTQKLEMRIGSVNGDARQLLRIFVQEVELNK